MATAFDLKAAFDEIESRYRRVGEMTRETVALYEEAVKVLREALERERVQTARLRAQLETAELCVQVKKKSKRRTLPGLWLWRMFR